jgi:hypothetical protein
MCNARRPDVQVPLTRTSRYAARWRLRDRAIGGRVRLALLVAIPALSLTSWAPVPQAFASGSSSPILSGYGSPGANMQAILGAAEARRQELPATGHAAGGSTGTSGTPATSTPATSTAPVKSGSGSQPGTTSNPAKARAGSGAVTPSEASDAGTPTTANGGAGIEPTHPVQGVQSAVVAAQPLGLSGGDLAAVLAVALALVPVGLLTRFVARNRG